MPVIKTQQKVKLLEKGDNVIITATDPGALHDIPAWCRIYGHRVISTTDTDGEVTIHIEIGGS